MLRPYPSNALRILSAIARPDVPVSHKKKFQYSSRMEFVAATKRSTKGSCSLFEQSAASLAQTEKNWHFALLVRFVF